MKYQVAIRKHNEKAHLDIESDLSKKKEGVFTFVLRVNNGNIVDYSVVEYVDVTKYTGLEQIIIEEFTLAFNYQSRGGGDAVRPDNLQRGSDTGSGNSQNAKHRQK